MSRPRTPNSPPVMPPARTLVRSMRRIRYCGLACGGADAAAPRKPCKQRRGGGKAEEPARWALVARGPIKTECDALRTQMGGTRGSPGDVAVAASRRHPNGHGSTQLLHRSPDFQRFVDYGITYTVNDPLCRNFAPLNTRSGLKRPIGQRVFRSIARSARISPMILANLKPWPEHGDAKTICGASGCSPRTKCSSGLRV